MDYSHRPLARREALHARPHAGVDQRPLRDVVRVAHGINEGEDGVHALQRRREGVDVAVVGLGPADSGAGFFFGCVLGCMC